MRIVNKDKIPFDTKFARSANATSGGIVTDIVIKKPHKTRDAHARARFITKDGGKSIIVEIYYTGENRDSMRKLFAHELAHAKIAMGQEEAVCDAFAEHLVSEYNNKE